MPLDLIDKQPKVLLQLLVYLFCLSIALRVLSYSSCQLNPKYLVEFPSELYYELRVSVRHGSRKRCAIPEAVIVDTAL